MRTDLPEFTLLPRQLRVERCQQRSSILVGSLPYLCHYLFRNTTLYNLYSSKYTFSAYKRVSSLGLSWTMFPTKKGDTTDHLLWAPNRGLEKPENLSTPLMY